MAVIEDFHDKNWITAKVFYKSAGEEKFRLEIINLETRLRYRHEKASDIACKAGKLVAAIPFYTMVNIICHVVRAVTLVFSLVIRSFVDLLTSFSPQTIENVFINLTYEMPIALIKTIWSIVKAPICAIGLEFCAICTTISPITWRVHFGNIERFWRGTDRMNNFIERGSELDRYTDFFTNHNSVYGFYLAYCFQPWGTLTDSNIVKNSDGTPRYEIVSPSLTG